MNFNLQLGKFSFNVGKSAPVTIADWLRGADSSATGAMLGNAFDQSVWVYGCVQTIAEQVAQIPFRFSTGQRGGENILEAGPVVDLFDRPHPFLNRFEFWEIFIQHLLIRGRVFVVALDNVGRVMNLQTDKAVPASLALLNPVNVQKVISGSILQGWRYSAAFGAVVESQMLLPEEVLFVRLPNPYDFWEGLAPMAVGMLAAQTDYASAQFMKGLMLNNADTGVIVTTDQQMTAEQRELIMAALRERKRSAGTTDRPLFLGGGAKVEKPTLSAVDMQFLENRKFNRQEICSVFRVPQEILGFTEDANRSVGESARYNFIENRVAPLCQRLEASVLPLVALATGGAAKSKNPKGRVYGFFDVESLPIMQAARRERFVGANGGFSMGVPLNVLNSVFDLGLPGNLPHADKCYLPFSLQEVGGTSVPATEGQTPNGKDLTGAGARPPEPAERMLAALAKATSPRPSPPVAERGTKVHTCAPNPAWEASTNGSIRLKSSKMKKVFFEQRMRVLAALDQIQTNDQSPKSKAIEPSKFDQLFNLTLENGKLVAKLKPLLIADLEFGGAQLFAEVGLADFKLPPEDAITFLGKRQKEIESINETTFEELKSSLTDALETGETYGQMVDRVKTVFQDASDFRAERVATTETTIAVNSGRFNAMELAEVDLKGWKAANLDNVRASHLRAEQDYVDGIPLDQAFRVGGFELMHPGDPSGPPGEVINCRCFTFAILKGKSAIPHKFLSYEEFLSQKVTKV
jgi:HK97 family phage portal protein